MAHEQSHLGASSACQHEESDPQPARPQQHQESVLLNLKGRFVANADQPEPSTQQRSHSPACSASVEDICLDGNMCSSMIMRLSEQPLLQPRTAWQSWWSKWLPSSFLRPPPSFSASVAALVRAYYEPDTGSVCIKLYSLAGSIRGLGAASVPCRDLGVALQCVRLQFDVRVDGTPCFPMLDLGAHGGDIRVLHQYYRVVESAVVHRQEVSNEQASTTSGLSSAAVAAGFTLPAGCQVSVKRHNEALIMRDDDPSRVPILMRSCVPVVATPEQVTVQLVQDTARAKTQLWRRSLTGLRFADRESPVQLLVERSRQDMHTPLTLEIICRASAHMQLLAPRGIVGALWRGGSAGDVCFVYAHSVRLGGHMEFTAHNSADA